MIPSSKINYQLPPENTARTYTLVLFWGGEQGGGRRWALLSAWCATRHCWKDGETDFSYDLAKNSHHSLSTRKHFNKV